MTSTSENGRGFDLRVTPRFFFFFFFCLVDFYFYAFLKTPSRREGEKKGAIDNASYHRNRLFNSIQFIFPFFDFSRGREKPMALIRMEQQNEMIIAKKLIWSTPGLTILTPPKKRSQKKKRKRTNRKFRVWHPRVTELQRWHNKRLPVSHRAGPFFFFFPLV